MSYTLEKLPNEAIIVYTQGPATHETQGIVETLDDIAHFLNAQSDAVFLIWNVGGMSIDMDDLIQSASKAGRGSNAVLHHSRVRENVYVVSNRMVRLAIKGLESATFGRAKVIQFDTLDEALSYCREQLKSQM
jgi:hypothetical protein